MYEFISDDEDYPLPVDEGRASEPPMSVSQITPTIFIPDNCRCMIGTFDRCRQHFGNSSEASSSPPLSMADGDITDAYGISKLLQSLKCTEEDQKRMNTSVMEFNTTYLNEYHDHRMYLTSVNNQTTNIDYASLRYGNVNETRGGADFDCTYDTSGGSNKTIFNSDKYYSNITSSPPLSPTIQQPVEQSHVQIQNATPNVCNKLSGNMEKNENGNKPLVCVQLLSSANEMTDKAVRSSCEVEKKSKGSTFSFALKLENCAVVNVLNDVDIKKLKNDNCLNLNVVCTNNDDDGNIIENTATINLVVKIQGDYFNVPSSRTTTVTSNSNINTTTHQYPTSSHIDEAVLSSSPSTSASAPAVPRKRSRETNCSQDISLDKISVATNTIEPTKKLYLDVHTQTTSASSSPPVLVPSVPQPLSEQIKSHTTTFQNSLLNEEQPTINDADEPMACTTPPPLSMSPHTISYSPTGSISIRSDLIRDNNSDDIPLSTENCNSTDDNDMPENLTTTVKQEPVVDNRTFSNLRATNARLVDNIDLMTEDDLTCTHHHANLILENFTKKIKNCQFCNARACEFYGIKKLLGVESQSNFEVFIYALNVLFHPTNVFNPQPFLPGEVCQVYSQLTGQRLSNSNLFNTLHHETPNFCFLALTIHIDDKPMESVKTNDICQEPCFDQYEIIFPTCKSLRSMTKGKGKYDLYVGLFSLDNDFTVQMDISSYMYLCEHNAFNQHLKPSEELKDDRFVLFHVKKSTRNDISFFIFPREMLSAFSFNSPCMFMRMQLIRRSNARKFNVTETTLLIAEDFSSRNKVHKLPYDEKLRRRPKAKIGLTTSPPNTTPQSSSSSMSNADFIN